MSNWLNVQMARRPDKDESGPCRVNGHPLGHARRWKHSQKKSKTNTVSLLLFFVVDLAYRLLYCIKYAIALNCCYTNSSFHGERCGLGI